MGNEGGLGIFGKKKLSLHGKVAKGNVLNKQDLISKLVNKQHHEDDEGDDEQLGAYRHGRRTALHTAINEKSMIEQLIRDMIGVGLSSKEAVDKAMKAFNKSAAEFKALGVEVPKAGVKLRKSRFIPLDITDAQEEGEVPDLDGGLTSKANELFDMRATAKGSHGEDEPPD